MGRRCSINVAMKPAMTITRKVLRYKKVVYFAVSNKTRKYPFGYRSSILYIGTTKKGAKRIAQSAATQAQRLLVYHGVKELRFHVVRCSSIPGVKTWLKLERALLVAFKHQYGSVPVGNTSVKRGRWRDEKDYFNDRRLAAVLRAFEK